MRKPGLEGFKLEPIIKFKVDENLRKEINIAVKNQLTVIFEDMPIQKMVEMTINEMYFQRRDAIESEFKRITDTLELVKKNMDSLYHIVNEIQRNTIAWKQ